PSSISTFIMLLEKRLKAEAAISPVPEIFNVPSLVNTHDKLSPSAPQVPLSTISGTAEASLDAVVPSTGMFSGIIVADSPIADSLVFVSTALLTIASPLIYVILLITRSNAKTTATQHLIFFHIIFLPSI